MISDKSNLLQLTGETLNIVQPSVWKSKYELLYKNELLGTISKRGISGTGINIKLFETEWEIYRPNFWLRETAIKSKGKENPIATYRREFFSREGFIFLPKGKKLKIKFGLFRSGYGIYNSSGICLVSFKDKITFKPNTELVIENSSEMLGEYPWIIILAWHLNRQRRRAAAK